MALPSTTVWECRANGNVNYGGGFNSARGGTDYTQQASPQLSLSDLFTYDYAPYTLHSTAGGFTAAMVGNLIHIVSGTGFTTGWYEITARTSSTVVTVDRAMVVSGTASGGTGYVGGAVTLSTAVLNATTPGNTVYLRAGSYSYHNETDSVNWSGINLLGYSSVRGDEPVGDDRPLITTGHLVLHGWLSHVRVTGSILLGGSSTGSSLVDYKQPVRNCAFDANGQYYACQYWGTEAIFIDCAFAAVGAIGLWLGGTKNFIHGCYFHDCARGLEACLDFSTVEFSVFDTCSVAGCQVDFHGWYSNFLTNTFFSCGKALYFTEVAPTIGPSVILNNIFSNNSYAVYRTGSFESDDPQDFVDYNNWWANAHDVTNVTKGTHDTAVDPEFTDAAGGDFSLATGSSCIGAAFSIRLGVGS